MKELDAFIHTYEYYKYFVDAMIVTNGIDEGHQCPSVLLELILRLLT